MTLQQTLVKRVNYIGREFYGGNDVEVGIEPADENEGILFDTKRGVVKSRLENAEQSRSSILLKNGSARVIHVEHLLATLFAYGIDNAIVRLRRIPTRSFRFLERFGIATDIEVVPVSQDRELTLCNLIDSCGLQEQLGERRMLNIDGPICTEKLQFEPIDEGLVIKATTNYSAIGEQHAQFEITPKNYKDGLSQSRAYAKHIPAGAPFWLASLGAALAYPSFGIGHGFTHSTVFLPVGTEGEWRAQEIYPAEIARHSIVDRLGAIALMDGRLDRVKVTVKYSGHANDIRVLRNINDRLKKYSKPI